MVNIAVLGYGTVGSGVVEVIRTNQEIINKKAGEEIKLINIQEYDVYYIQLPDGRTGFISTQLAG